MSLCVVRLQFERLLISRQCVLRVALALPSDAQVVIAGRQLWSYVNRFLEERESVVKFLLLKRIHALQGKHLRLCKAGTELTQSADLLEFLIGGILLSLS